MTESKTQRIWFDIQDKLMTLDAFESFLREERRRAFTAGQKSVGWRDDMMSRIDSTFEQYEQRLEK